MPLGFAPPKASQVSEIGPFPRRAKLVPYQWMQSDSIPTARIERDIPPSNRLRLTTNGKTISCLFACSNVLCGKLQRVRNLHPGIDIVRQFIARAVTQASKARIVDVVLQQAVGSQVARAKRRTTCLSPRRRNLR